jgi:transposase InsO family protein
MAHDNPTWGEERIADELKLKLGIRVSPRTVRKYMDRKRPHRGADQRWATFVRNEAKAIVACDFFISVTLSFRVLYVCVAMEIGSRRILHCNVTAHATAEWLDLTLNDFGVRVIRTPVQAPTTNAFCERLIGTIRRECLDYLIPLSERHLRLTLREFVAFSIEDVLIWP